MKLESELAVAVVETSSALPASVIMASLAGADAR